MLGLCVAIMVELEQRLKEGLLVVLVPLGLLSIDGLASDIPVDEELRERTGLLLLLSSSPPAAAAAAGMLLPPPVPLLLLSLLLLALSPIAMASDIRVEGPGSE